MPDVPARPPGGAAPAAADALHVPPGAPPQAAWAFPDAQAAGRAARLDVRRSPRGGEAVRITVLGKSPSWQDAGGACSGYLVQDGGTTVLLDCGNGVFGKLRRFVDYVDVDAVVISPPARRPLPRPRPVQLRADLRAAPAARPGAHAGPARTRPRGPALHAPPGARATSSAASSAPGATRTSSRTPSTLREYEPARRARDRPARASASAACRTSCPRTPSSSRADGRRFTYGADCSPTEELVDFARDTDLLMIEATLPRPERTGVRGHLTPGEAGEHGRAAGARRLVRHPHLRRARRALGARARRRATFGGPVEVAREGAVYEL